MFLQELKWVFLSIEKSVKFWNHKNLCVSCQCGASLCLYQFVSDESKKTIFPPETMRLWKITSSNFMRFSCHHFLSSCSCGSDERECTRDKKGKREKLFHLLKSHKNKDFHRIGSEKGTKRFYASGLCWQVTSCAENFQCGRNWNCFNDTKPKGKSQILVTGKVTSHVKTSHNQIRKSSPFSSDKSHNKAKIFFEIFLVQY